MDIMNNMTVSSSKFTFSLIAISRIIHWRCWMLLLRNANAAVPTFVAVHNSSTTTTEVTFSEGTNGTLEFNTTGELTEFKPQLQLQMVQLLEKTLYGDAQYGGSAVGVSKYDYKNCSVMEELSTIIPGANIIMLTHASL